MSQYRIALLLVIASVAGCATSRAPSCAADTSALTAPGVEVIKVMPCAGINIGHGGFQTTSDGDLSGNWEPTADGDLLGISLPVHSGQRFDQISAAVYGNTAYRIRMTLLAQDDAYHVAASLGHAVSEPTNTIQTLTIDTPSDGTQATETVEGDGRAYMLQFRIRQLGAGEGHPFVGPIALTMAN
jgi:hypothetical protein